MTPSPKGLWESDVSLSDYIPLFPRARDDLACPLCGDHLRIRERRDGRPFYGCVRFPDCKGAHSALQDGQPIQGFAVFRQVFWERLASSDVFDE